MRRCLLLLLCLAAAGCGEEREAEAPGQPRSELTVTVHPQGPGGPTERKVVDCTDNPACDVALAPTPPDVACTEIYGGPATATVEGTRDGRRVTAAFSRENGCEIARWDEAEALIGPAPP